MDDLDRMFRRLVQNIRTGYPDLLSRPFEVGELYQNIIPYRHNRSELGLEQNQDYEFALMRLLSGERGYLVVDDALRDGMQRELASPSPDTGAFRAFASSPVSLSGEAVRRLDQYLAGGARPDDARLGRTAPRVAAAPTVAASPPPPPPPPALTSPRFADRPPAPPPIPAAAPPPPPPPIMSVPPIPPPRSLEADAAAATVAMPGTPRHEAPRNPGPRGDAAPAPERRPEPPPAAREVRQAAGGAPEQPRAGAGHGAGHGAGSGGPPVEADQCRYCGGTLPMGRRVVFCPHCGQNLTVRHCPACSTELEVGWKFCISCGRSVEA